MRVRVCTYISVSIQWNVQASATFVSLLCLCVYVLYMCVLMCGHEGADTDGEGECQGQGQTRETLFTRERWRGRWESEGTEREERKKEIQGEMLLSLTTKTEVRQGQTVRDHLTVASCTCVAHTSPGPLKIIQGSSLVCRATSHTTVQLGCAVTETKCYN